MVSKTPAFLELHTRVYELGLLLRKEGRTVFTEDDIRRKHRYHYNIDIPFDVHGLASLTDFLLFSDRRYKQVIFSPWADQPQNYVTLLKENYMLKYAVPPNADNIPKLVTLEDDEEEKKAEEAPPPRILQPKLEPRVQPPPQSDRVKEEPLDPYPGEIPPSGNNDPLAAPIVIDEYPSPPSPPIKREIEDEIPPPRSPSPEPREYGPGRPPEDPENGQIEEAPENPPPAGHLQVSEPEPLVDLNHQNAAFIKKDISSTIMMCLMKAEWVTVDEVRAAYSERYKPSFDEDCASIGCTTMEELAKAFQGYIDIYQNEFQQWICKLPEQINTRGRAEPKNFLFSFPNDDRRRRDEKRKRRDSPERNGHNQRYQFQKNRSRSRSPVVWVHDKFEDISPPRDRERRRHDEDRRRDRSPETKRSPKRSPSPRRMVRSVAPSRFGISNQSSNKHLSSPRPDVDGKRQHGKFEKSNKLPPRTAMYGFQHDDRVEPSRTRRAAVFRRDNDYNKNKPEGSKERDWSPPLDANGKWEKGPRKDILSKQKNHRVKNNSNLVPLKQNFSGSHPWQQVQALPNDSSRLSAPNSHPGGEASTSTGKGGKRAKEMRAKVSSKDEVATEWKADPNMAAKEAFYKFFPKWKKDKKKESEDA